MTEFFSQRNMLNAQNKCDLNQSFKTKMKLITDSTPTIINSNISNVINLNQVCFYFSSFIIDLFSQ